MTEQENDLVAEAVQKAYDQGYSRGLTDGRKEASSPSGWQDIASAPRPEHGRRKVIDVWCVTDDHESAQFYFGNTMSGVKDQKLWQGRVNEVYWLDGAWRPATGLRMHGLTVQPTHWMPLPAPPAGEGR